MFVCLDQDGHLCCSFIVRCGDAGRAVGYDGVVAGTPGVPQLPGSAPSGTAVALVRSTPDPREHAKPPPTSTATTATTYAASAPAASSHNSPPPQVDNTSAVSAEKVVSVSGSQDSGNKTETESGDSSGDAG